MNRKSIMVIFAVFLLLYMFATQNNIWFSPDSTAYISMAKNFLKNHSFLISGVAIKDSRNLPKLPTYTTLWPVGFSLSISLISAILKAPPAVSSKFLVVILSIINFWILYTMYKKILKNHNTLTALGIVIYTQAYFFISSMVWSENLFLTLTILSFIFMHDYFKTRKIVYLILGSTLAGLTFSVRYIGIAFIFSVVVTTMYFLISSEENRWKSLILIVMFISIISLTVLPTILRNYTISDHFLGESRPPNLVYQGHPLKLITDFAKSFVQLFFIPAFSGLIEYRMFAYIFTLILTLPLTIFFRNVFIIFKDFKIRNLIWLFPIVYIITYLMVLIYSELTAAIDLLSFRFIFPIWPFIVMIIFRKIKRHLIRWLSVLILSSITVLTVGIVFMQGIDIENQLENIVNLLSENEQASCLQINYPYILDAFSDNDRVLKSYMIVPKHYIGKAFKDLEVKRLLESNEFNCVIISRTLMDRNYDYRIKFGEFLGDLISNPSKIEKFGFKYLKHLKNSMIETFVFRR